MNRQEFIATIGAYIKKYAPLYGIKVCSPIIAQAVLESGGGTSELARNANNFFGLKWRENRCKTAVGYYVKQGSEQNPDGSYVSSIMKWMKFKNMEDGVIGYFDFINNSNYANLKGVTDPKTYVANIKMDGYATSLNYIDNIMSVIDEYNLTKYDQEEERAENKMLIAIDAGHGLKTSGKRCKKSIDPNETREWVLNDRIADKLQDLLAEYECETIRVDDTTGAKDISLQNRVQTANNMKADIYISIHHNAGVNGGSGGGTIVYYCSSKPERKSQAIRLYQSVVGQTKLAGNRSTKVSNHGFYVIKHTKMPAFLIENGFMDSTSDTPIILTSDHAIKTAQGLCSFLVTELSLNKKEGQNGANTQPQDASSFKVKVTADSLNVRAGAGTAYKVNTTIKKGGIYTITEEKDGWGKLKSGAGWISLKYTVRV